MSKLIYMDNAATTQVYPEVLDEMLPYFTEHYGNPSAIYSFAGEAKRGVDHAREIVAKAIGAKTDEIYFTGGGSESDNWALKATAEAYANKGKHIITTAIEHHAILHTGQWLEKHGYDVTYVGVEEDDDTTKSYISQPLICPICGEPLYESGTDTIILYCSNPNCEGRIINKFDHFCGKKGLDIKGLSKATLEKLIDWEWINTYEDLYKLKEHKSEWIKKPGFGEKSVDNILNAIENSRTPKLESFISAIGIPLIGNTVSKELVKHINSYEEFKDMVNNKEDFTTFDNIAEEKAKNILNFDYTDADAVYKYMNIAAPALKAQEV